MATIGGSNVLGKGHSYGVSLIYGLPPEGPWAHSLSVGVDFKDFESLQFGGAEDKVPLKYAPITLGYNGYRYTEASQLGLGLALVAGTREFLGYGSDAEAFDYKRYRANPSFAVFRATPPTPSASAATGSRRPAGLPAGLRAAGLQRAVLRRRRHQRARLPGRRTHGR